MPRRTGAAMFWPADPRVDLAAGLVHDINNLLSVVASACEAALETLEPDHPAYDDIALAGGAIGRLRSLAVQLLSVLARPLDAGTPIYRNALVELVPLLRRVVGPLVQLTVADEDILATSLSTLEFERIVLNLVLNAHRAIEGSGRIDVSIRQVEHARDPDGVVAPHLQLIVADDGVGIPGSIRERLFDPGVGTGDGHGLGLAVVRQAVKASGGTVRVWSEPGRGTRFTVTVPSLSQEE